MMRSERKEQNGGSSERWMSRGMSGVQEEGGMKQETERIKGAKLQERRGMRGQKAMKNGVKHL